jgi:cobalt/nickel transport system permease protein
VVVAAVVVSLELGAFGVVVETVLSGRTDLPFAKFAPLMLGIHLPIAVCEGVLTAGLLRFVARVKPGVPASAPSSPAFAADGRLRWLLVSLALAALLMAGVGSWFASQKPDGLEWATARVAGTEAPARAASGWLARTQQWVSHLAIFPDYNFKKPAGADSAAAAGGVAKPGTSAAGVVGALATGLLVAGVCGTLWLLRRRRGCVGKRA